MMSSLSIWLWFERFAEQLTQWSKIRYANDVIIEQMRHTSQGIRHFLKKLSGRNPHEDEINASLSRKKKASRHF